MSHNRNQSRAVARFPTLYDLSVNYEGHSENIVTRPPDISTRGMFINTASTFPEGAILSVQFRLAHSGVEVRARAEVRYCLAGVGVGVEFIEISSEAMRAIEKEISIGDDLAKT
jgi:PilZ domain